MASWLLLLVAFGRVRAEAPWLTVESQGSCTCRAEQLAQRIEKEVAGVRPNALGVVVEIESGVPVRAHVKLSAEAQPLGETQVEASSCDEALAAVTAIAALALSAFPQPESTAARRARVTPRAAPLEVAASPRLAEAAAFRRDESLRDRGASRRWRVLAAAGVAAGGSVRATVLVLGGAAWELGRGELRLLGRYGVPATDERVEARSTSLRSDFGAASIDYCVGLDRAHWLSLCGGLELLSKRTQVVEQSAEAGRTASTQQSLLFGPSAGLSFVLRNVVGQPQLELSALVPVVGASPLPGFRAALGGGVPF